MNEFWKDVGIAVTMGLLVPAVLLAGVVSMAESPPERMEETQPTIMETLPAEGMLQMEVAVLQKDGEVAQLPLNTYLTGVVLAEMPVSFEDEALKAQAVVARTYTLRAVSGSAKHMDTAVCTDSTCCQGYLSVEEFLAKGGKESDAARILELVEATENQVLTYDGKLIEATYFSCSGGRTEDAVAVWGTDVPYLRSVESPGEEQATHYTDKSQMTGEELSSKLGLKLTGNPAAWFGCTTYTAGGGVAEMEIGGQVFTGTQLRKLLGLRSTAFSVSVERNQITIISKGYGHRVGMSQYGADAMAATGSDYAQILQYYYQGTALTQYED